MVVFCGSDVMIRLTVLFLIGVIFGTLHAESLREYRAVRFGAGVCLYDGAPGGVMTASLGPLYMGDRGEGNWTFQPHGTAILEIHREDRGLPLTLLGGGGVTLGLYKFLSPSIIAQLLGGMRSDHFVWGGRAGIRLTGAELAGLEIVWQQLKRTPEIQILFTVDFGAIRHAAI